MTEFGDCLSRFIREGKIDKGQLADHLGIPPAMLSDYLKGKALPERSEFRKFLHWIPLTIEEEALLSHSYYVSSVGEWTYRRRLFIQQQLAALAQMIKLYPSQRAQSYFGEGEYGALPEEGVQLFQGPLAIESILRRLLNEEIAGQENPLVCTNVLLRKGMLQRVLLGMYLDAGGKLEIRHILQFTKDTGKTLHNLEALFSVLPFCIAPGAAYHPWFYYSEAPLYADTSTPFSFYLYTHKRLLWVSEDMDAAALVSSGDLLEAYRERFERAVHLSRPLICQASTAEQMIDASAAFYTSARPYETYSLELQPCLGPFLTLEILERMTNREQDGTPELARTLFEYYQSMAVCMTKITSVCWERGLNLFIEEGRLCAFPPIYARALSMNDRLDLLKRFRQGVCEGKVTLYIVNEARFPFVENFSLHCQGDRKVAFDVHDAANPLFANIIFEEQSLCGAFYDFIHSMPEGEWVYSREETLEILDRGIVQCARLAAREAEEQNGRVPF